MRPCFARLHFDVKISVLCKGGRILQAFRHWGLWLSEWNSRRGVYSARWKHRIPQAFRASLPFALWPAGVYGVCVKAVCIKHIKKIFWKKVDIIYFIWYYYKLQSYSLELRHFLDFKYKIWFFGKNIRIIRDFVIYNAFFIGKKREKS